MNTHILKKTEDFTVILDKEKKGLEFYFTNNTKEEFNRCIDLSEKIGFLPSEELKQLAHTQDLKNNWENERRFSRDISTRFLISVFKIDGEFVDNLIADKLSAVLVEATAGKYEALRKLLKAGFSILKKYFPTCPITPEDLLFQIIEEERNLPFINIITNDFVQYEPSKLAKIHGELSKKDATVIDKTIIEKYKPSHTKKDKTVMLSTCVLLCLTENSDRTPKLQKSKIAHCFNIYNESQRYLDEILAEGYSRRTNQGKAIPTVTWNNGEILYSDAGRYSRKSP